MKAGIAPWEDKLLDVVKPERLTVFCTALPQARACSTLDYTVLTVFTALWFLDKEIGTGQ